MKYNVTVSGHSAEVEIIPGANGSFTGAITHTDFGDGRIVDGTQTGNQLDGTVILGGHTAEFQATLDGDRIAGRVRLNWLLSASFEGTAIA